MGLKFVRVFAPIIEYKFEYNFNFFKNKKTGLQPKNLELIPFSFIDFIYT